MHVPPSTGRTPDAERPGNGGTGRSSRSSSRSSRRRRAVLRAAPAALAATALILLVSTFLPAPPGPATATADGAPRARHSGPRAEGDRLARQLVRRTDAHGALRHLRALRSIAERSGGTRAAGTRGHERSARYAGALLKAAGYRVTYQRFDFVHRRTLAEKLTLHGSPRREVPVRLMSYTKNTPEGGLTAPLAAVPVDADGSTGCEARDYTGARYGGRIALIRRGSCSFAQKQAAAADAGAVGALIYNTGQGELSGTLGKPSAARIPTAGLARSDGEALAKRAAASGGATVTLDVREHRERRSTPNVLAETPWPADGRKAAGAERGTDGMSDGQAEGTADGEAGRKTEGKGDGKADRKADVVMIGAHLDSVPEGPGINDNASGSSGVLETALRLADATRQTHRRPPHPVRFALWSAEELGLQGSRHYVDALSRSERDSIALYLNFDMIASPNYGIFAFDGDDSDHTGAGPGPKGSAALEKGLTDFLAGRGLATRGTDFDGRSDYGPFIEAGIPAGGTFTGGDGIKTAEERQLWGGTAGKPYDSCYHRPCDTLKNIDMRALDANVKAIADAAGHYAWDLGPLPARRSTASAPGRTATRPTERPATGPYRGPHLIR
ncbi:M28 family peptidase [Streptomyces cacaoi]|uniref:M28 family peptidase n=1 Tax=Streptomyces cacaoi TaxID=1898 RepID=UPI00260EF8EC|nr:M28 family peptidase [Streptomyces cacaoi]